MPNRLANSHSPYLRQHADNPVDWYEWNNAALETASRENKPILLSIGYSACHWCHVMAHESFEDVKTATLMNNLFINIKVDREERPDLDKIYQTSQSLLTQRSGGWPLTMFLHPQTLAPFFGGTYFPKEARGALPSFSTVLTSISDYFKTHGDEVIKQGNAVRQALGEIYAPNQKSCHLPPSIAQTTCQSIADQYDATYGGFGNAPKFPRPGYLEFLLNYPTHLSKKQTLPAADMALTTLRKMTCGGIYDQLGGGFYRYSVDIRWMIPHFEKMLYDNGSLLSLLADAHQLTNDVWFADKTQETADWVLREMQASEGGYYSSLDADSESGEGVFYSWDKTEIETLLNQEEAALIKQHLGMNQPPNFEGKWHLYIHCTATEIATQNEADEVTITNHLTQAKQRLLTSREQRLRPGRDDKILTAWNALMIKGMAKAAMVLDNSVYGESATKAYDFIRRELYTDGKLYACWNQTRSAETVFLDDFAFLLDATLYLLQYRWDSDNLQFAMTLADTLIKQFEDPEHGGYFFTPSQHSDLLQRPRVMYDEAMASGYGSAVIALTRLGFLCGREDYLQSAERALHQASATLLHSPTDCATLIQAYMNYHQPSPIIILRGNTTTLKKWQNATLFHKHPNQFCFAIPADTHNLPAALAEKKAQNNQTVAYICEGSNCLTPINQFGDYIKYFAQ